MLDENYINFFEELKRFNEKQKKQKQRGLNDYNMVNVVRKENAEVGMHSNVIYSLIDPNGLHYQDDLFLQIFIKDVLEIHDFGDILSVNAEESTNENIRALIKRLRKKLPDETILSQGGMGYILNIIKK